MEPHQRRAILAYTLLVGGTVLSVATLLRGGPADVMLAGIVAALTAGSVAAVVGK